MILLDQQLVSLIVRVVRKAATEEEKMQLEQWASLSHENRTWLERFYNYDWVNTQVQIYEDANLEKSRKKLWHKIRRWQMIQRLFMKSAGIN